MHPTALLHRLLRRAGVDAVRFPAPGTLAFVLRRCSIDTVLDVGANTGQTGTYLRSLNFKGRIISFEPYSTAFTELAARCAGDALWTCEQCALGDSEGELDLRISELPVYSSFLHTLEFAHHVDPVSRARHTEKVRVVTLDNVWPALAVDGRQILLKIDTQGYERQVLDGAANSLARIAALQVEMSIHPLYAGQPTLIEMLQYLQQRRFLLAGIQPGWNDPETGELLECDGIFVREGACK